MWARLALVVPVTLAVLVISIMFILALGVPSASMKTFPLQSSRQVLALVRVLVPGSR